MYETIINPLVIYAYALALIVAYKVLTYKPNDNATKTRNE